MTHLISIIGEQLRPNYLFIKEMEGKYDDLIFVSNKRMHEGGEGRRIEKALGRRVDSVRRVIVTEEDLNEMLADIERAEWPSGDRYIVNLTGGTKIMAIGCYQFFAKYDALFYYVPVWMNKIENVHTSADLPLHYRMNLHEYLTLYGLTAEHDTEFIHSPEHTRNLYGEFKNRKFDRYRVPELLHAHEMPNEADRRYYGGVWFEEYVYQRLKEEQHLSDDAIWRGVKLFRDDSGEVNDNEIDVMFMKHNELYVGECKVSLKGGAEASPGEMLERYMYKLAAITKDFGINVHPYIFTLHRMNRFSERQLKALDHRSKILGIEAVLTGESFLKARLVL